MKLFPDTLKRNRGAILLFLTVSLVSLSVFLLYGISLEPFWYAFVLGLVFLLLLLLISFLKEKHRIEALNYALRAAKSFSFELPEPSCLADESYTEIIAALGEEISRLKTDFDNRESDAVDYYTTWVHQIKTPIAVMRLKLADDTPENRALTAELFRIEQYVDMVLQYIRLGSASTDLVIQEYPLDDLIRETIRKYASQFIEKKLRLDFTPSGAVIITDRKWYCTILDQLVSNAIKYTPQGCVTISADASRVLISDTGIGIAPEDIPRIFEKGFTGSNGRLGEKSSGLGLYLAKKAADLIAVDLSVRSEVGKGTEFEVKMRE